MNFIENATEHNLTLMNAAAAAATAHNLISTNAAAAHNLISITDKNGVILYANKKFCDVSQYSVDELIGKTHRIINSGFHTKEHMKTMWGAIKNDGKWSGVFKNRAKDGSFYWVETSITKIQNTESGEISYVAVRTKVTEQTIAEYDLTERVKELNCLNKIQKGLLEIDDSEAVIDLVLACLVDGLNNRTELSMSLQIHGIEKYSSELYLDYKKIKTATITLGVEIGGALTVYSNDGRTLSLSENALIDSICFSLSNWLLKRQSLNKIRELNFVDLLTGLPNRRYLYDRLNLARSTSSRSGRCGAVLFIDIDKFKTINDSFGHKFGDELLIEVSRRIRQCVRENDVVSRFGGDEFIVLLDALNEDESSASDEACLVTDKILESLRGRLRINQRDISSSSSIGICVFNGKDFSAEELIRFADIAMYECKNSGRNARRLYSSGMRDKVLKRLTLEFDIREALIKKEFFLNYQIQLDNNKNPIGAEALLRWVHPEKGNIPPLEFLPTAEESGLISEIGYWVLDEACNQLDKWSENEQFKKLSISVNVSSRQFSEIDFIDNLETLIKSYHFDPSNLVLELTESLMVNTDSVLYDFNRLKMMGIRLSMDDFGTGYSSLSYIQKLPINQIKIDKSFMNEIDLNSNGRSMVKTIIDMSQNFDFEVVAEGIETESQFLFLNECSSKIQFQGFLFGKPLPIEGFEKSLLQLVTKDPS